MNFWGKCIQDGVLTISCIGPLITLAINVALGLAGTVAVFLIIYAGLQFIMSGGGKGVEQARKTFTYAIVGLLVVLLAYFIISLLSHITGVGCLLSGNCQ